MAFNISSFKSTMDRFGGPARASLFEVTVSAYQESAGAFGSKGFGSREFTFFCSAAQIPGITINTINFEAVSQLPKPFPMTVMNNPFSVVFMVDSDHQVLNFFHQWIQSVVNYGTKGGMTAEVDGALPFELGYKDEYSARISVKHYSTESYPDKYYEVIFDKAFPMVLGDLDLAWENNNQFLTLPVTFGFDRIEFSGERTGTPNSRLDRVGGLLDLLGAVAGFADVIRQTRRADGRFTSIQDAVNRVTRVTNSFDNISNKLGI